MKIIKRGVVIAFLLLLILPLIGAGGAEYFQCNDGTSRGFCSDQKYCGTEELISNNGFEVDENGIPDGFIRTNAQANSMIDPNEAYKGNKSIKLIGKWSSFGQDVTLDEGELYSFIAYVKGECQRIAVYYNDEDGRGHNLNYEARGRYWYWQATSVWQPIIMDFNAPASRLNKLRIECAENMPSSGLYPVLWVDSIHLERNNQEQPSVLVDNCGYCGCPDNDICNADGTCPSPEVPCEDGTPKGTCNSDFDYCGNKNILHNSGFEVLDNTQFPDHYIQNSEAYLDNEVSFAGDNSVRISQRWASLDLDERLILDASTDYLFRAKVRGACNDYRLFGKFRDNTYSLCSLGLCNLNNDGEWKTFTANFNSNNFDNEILERLRLECADTNPSGTLYPSSWIDSMSLERKRKNLVENPGFERAVYGQTNIPNGWNKNNPGQPDNIFTIDWSPFGLYLANITADSSSSWYGIKSDPIQLKGNTQYKLTGFTKGASTSDFIITVHVRPLEGAGHNFYCSEEGCRGSETITISEHNYNKWEKTFTTLDDDNLYAFIIPTFRSGRGGTAKVDAISLEEIEEQSELLEDNCAVCGCPDNYECNSDGGCDEIPPSPQIIEPRVGIFPITYNNLGTFFIERPKINIADDLEANCFSDIVSPSKQITVWGRITNNRFQRIRFNPINLNQGIFSTWEFCNEGSGSQQIPEHYAHELTYDIDADGTDERIAVEESENHGWVIALYDSILSTELESKRTLYEEGKNTIKILADDKYDLYLNGELVGSGDWEDINIHALDFDIGENIIGIRARDTGGKEGLLFEVYINGELLAKSDDSWKIKLLQDMTDYERNNWNQIGSGFDTSSWETPEEEHRRDNTDAITRGGFLFGKWIWGDVTKKSKLNGNNEGYAFRKVITIDSNLLPNYDEESVSGGQSDAAAAAKLAIYVKDNNLEGINTLPPAYKAAGKRKYSEYNCDITNCPSSTCIQNALEFCCSEFLDKSQKYSCKQAIVDYSGLVYTPDSTGKLYKYKNIGSPRDDISLRINEDSGGWLEYVSQSGSWITTDHFAFLQPIWHRGVWLEFTDDGTWIVGGRETKKKAFQNTLPYDVLHGSNGRIYLCNEKGIFLDGEDTYYYCNGNAWNDLRLDSNVISGCPDADCIRTILNRECDDEDCRTTFLHESGLLFESADYEQDSRGKKSVCQQGDGEPTFVDFVGDERCGAESYDWRWNGKSVYVEGDEVQSFGELPDGEIIWRMDEPLEEITNIFSYDLLKGRNSMGIYWFACDKRGIAIHNGKFNPGNGKSYYCNGGTWEEI